MESDAAHHAAGLASDPTMTNDLAPDRFARAVDTNDLAGGRWDAVTDREGLPTFVNRARLAKSAVRQVAVGSV